MCISVYLLKEVKNFDAVYYLLSIYTIADISKPYMVVSYTIIFLNDFIVTICVECHDKERKKTILLST